MASNGPLAVAVGDNGRVCSWNESDSDWTRRDGGFGFTTVNDVIYTNGIWIAVGNNGKASISNDGVSWTASSLGLPKFENIAKILFAGGRFLTISKTGKLHSSADGNIWVAQSSISFSGNPWIALGTLRAEYSYVLDQTYDGAYISNSSTEYVFTVVRRGMSYEKESECWITVSSNIGDTPINIIKVQFASGELTKQVLVSLDQFTYTEGELLAGTIINAEVTKEQPYVPH